MFIMIAVLLLEVVVLVIKTLVFGLVHFFLFIATASTGPGPPHTRGF
jgi:hypothetical protein